jgi:hypothetical protein
MHHALTPYAIRQTPYTIQEKKRKAQLQVLRDKKTKGQSSRLAAEAKEAADRIMQLEMELDRERNEAEEAEEAAEGGGEGEEEVEEEEEVVEEDDLTARELTPLEKKHGKVRCMDSTVYE